MKSNSSGNIEYLFVVMYVLASLGMAATLLVSNETDSLGYGSSFGFVFLWVCLYLFTGSSIVFSNEDYLFRTYPNELMLVFFGFFIVVSSSWSVLIKQSLTYSISLLANFLFIIFIYRKFSLKDFLVLVQYSLNVMILLGLILGLLGYEKAIYIDPLSRGNVFGTELIKGLFSHKIYTGVYATLAVILNLTFLKGKVLFFWIMIGVLSVVLAGSATGMVVLIVAMSAYYLSIFFRAANFPKGFTLFFFFIFLFFCFALYLALPYVFEALGRDQNMTGRGSLWGWAYIFWCEQPLLGWGYLGIFGEYDNAPSNIINDGSFYIAPHFHNSYLQILTELGLIGFVFYFSAITWCGKMCWSLWVRCGDLEYLASFVCLIVIFLAGFVVNIGLKYNEFSTLLLFYLCLSVFYGRRNLHENMSVSE